MGGGMARGGEGDEVGMRWGGGGGEGWWGRWGRWGGDGGGARKGNEKVGMWR